MFDFLSDLKYSWHTESTDTRLHEEQATKKNNKKMFAFKEGTNISEVILGSKCRLKNLLLHSHIWTLIFKDRSFWSVKAKTKLQLTYNCRALRQIITIWRTSFQWLFENYSSIFNLTSTYLFAQVFWKLNQKLLKRLKKTVILRLIKLIIGVRTVFDAQVDIK